MKRVLLEPITAVNTLLKKLSGDAVNSAWKSLCSEADVYPLSEKAKRPATTELIHTLLGQPDGTMWQIYKQFLSDSLDCNGNQCSEKPSPRYKQSPLIFFSRLNNWSHLIESGGHPGLIRLSLQAMPFNHLKMLELTIDDQPALRMGADARTTITWDIQNSKRLRLDGVFEAGAARGCSRLTPQALGRFSSGSSLPGRSAVAPAGFIGLRAGVPTPLYASTTIKPRNTKSKSDGWTGAR